MALAPPASVETQRGERREADGSHRERLEYHGLECGVGSPIQAFGPALAWRASINPGIWCIRLHRDLRRRCRSHSTRTVRKGLCGAARRRVQFTMTLEERERGAERRVQLRW